MNVFADDITIEDDMAVLVKYNNKATMTYHLTAYSVSEPPYCSFPSTVIPSFRSNPIFRVARLTPRSLGKATV